MEIFKIVGFALASLFLILTLNENKKDIALIISLVAGITILVFAMNEIKEIMNLITDLINLSTVNKEYFMVILKVIGISYVVEIGKNVCEDAGSKGLASKIEIAGKVIVISLSIPIILSLLKVLTQVV